MKRKKEMKALKYFSILVVIGVVLILVFNIHLNPTGNIIETASTEKSTSYIYGNGLVASYDSDGNEKFYINDHLGGTSVVLDENGNKISEESYYAFGEEKTSGDSRFTYTGKEKDDSGLYYYGARYYDADSGRFTQPDPISGSLGNPQSLNKYVYVLNNPNKYVDPSGMASQFAVGGVEPLENIIYESYDFGDGGFEDFEGPVSKEYPDPINVINGDYGQEYIDAINHLQETAKGLGLNPLSVTGAFFKEGFNVQVAQGKTNNINTVGPVGMEAFGSDEQMLKSKGYLRGDFIGFSSIGWTSTYTNEAGDKFPRGRFDTMLDQVEAFAALYANYQDQFFDDARTLGYDSSSLSTNVVETWTYRYYITGRYDKIKEDGTFRPGAGTDLRNALQEGGVEGLIKQSPSYKSRAWSGQRAAATANRLREAK